MYCNVMLFLICVNSFHQDINALTGFKFSLLLSPIVILLIVTLVIVTSTSDNHKNSAQELTWLINLQMFYSF